MTIRPVTNPIRLVQREINQSLEQASALLDAFEQNADDVPPWERCREHLEEVHGALVMLDLVGAVCLVDECLAMINALENDQALARDQGLDLLVYGMLLLPRYVNRARGQKRELPETLLPALNALRALRRAVLLPDYHFAEFDHVDPALAPMAAPARQVSGNMQERACRLRHMFQVGLLGLFRTPDSAVHAKQLHRSLTRMGETFGDTVTSRWLRLAARLAALTVTGEMPVDASVRLMYSRLDIHVREAVRSGLEREPPAMLRRGLLYYTLLYSQVDARLKALQDALGLHQALSFPSIIEHEREAMAAPDHSVMQAVSDALAEDLDRLKATIETLSRLSSVTASEREDLCLQLNSLGHTLTMLGLSEPAAQLKREHTRLQSVGKDVSAERLWELLQSTAEALTLAEESVDSLAVSGRSASGHKRSERIRAAEHQAITECLTNLARVRHAMEYLNGDVDEGEELDATEEPLREVSGILRVMGRESAADLVERACRQIGGLTPEHEGSEELATLADALAAVEWYLEGLLEDSDNGEDALEIGDEALKTLERGMRRVEPTNRTVI
ncbi:MAG: hypothetical protein WED00_01930 [Aquisalimonadaceae bacterium]